MRSTEENDLEFSVLNENYKITIHDTHMVCGERTESTTAIMGNLNIAEDGYTISYEDNSGDFEGSITSIKVTEPNYVYMSRSGDYSTDLMLELKKRHSCHYETPYGGFMMGVYAHKIDSNMDSSGGSLCFAYSLDVGGGSVSENELHINVKEITNV